MRHKSIVIVLAFILALFAAPALWAQGQSAPPPAGKTEVLQFHLEHRCATCLKIEKLTRATLAAYFKDVPFALVNVEKKENGKMAEQFGVYGTALFLYNPATGKKKNLTELAFLKVGNEAVFTAELKKQIEEFLKS